MTNCLEQAKQAYKDVIENKDIEDVYAQLAKYKENGLREGANLAQELTRFAAQGVNNYERGLKALQLQQLKSMQATVDKVMRIKEWEGKGISNPIIRALKANIAGSVIRFQGARASTELKMNTARIKYMRDFHNDIHGELASLWNAKENELQIANALLKLYRGEEQPNTPFKRLAEIVKKYNDKLLSGMREEGIDIHELDDRIAPNIHDKHLITKLDRTEKEIAYNRYQDVPKERALYLYAYNRWKNFTLSRLDVKRTFTDHGIDFKNKEQVDAFMEKAFDNIVNSDRAGNRGTNIGTRLTQSRVLHWNDAESLVSYNDRFGSGALQDSINREQGFGFGRLEHIKDWGVNAQTTLERTLQVIEEDPQLKQRLGKGPELTEIKNLLSALTQTTADYPGTAGQILRNIRAFQSMVKLGLVTIKSIPDLGLLAAEASRNGLRGYQAIGEAVKNIFTGLHPDELIAMKDLINTMHQHHLGSVAKYNIEGLAPSSLAAWGLRLTNKLNGLEYWDYTLRSTATAIVSRRFAQLRGLSWETLGEENQTNLRLYNIDKADWNAIRQSAVKPAGGKLYITPDSIHSLSDDVIKESLREKGATGINETRIKQYRDSLEDKLYQYFQDRADHVILRPGVLDEQMLAKIITAGAANGVPTSDAGRQVLRLFGQFKLYAMAYARVPLGTVLYGKGAKDFREATVGGKGDYVGVAKLMGYMMGMKYASMTIENLINGMSPPALNKKDTWINMLKESAGFYGMMANVDLSDLSGSLTRAFEGPTFSDLDKAARVLYHFGDDTINNDDYSKTSKAFYKFGRGLVPKYPYSAYVMNNLLLSEWEDYVDPGARQKYLDDIEAKSGSSRIF